MYIKKIRENDTTHLLQRWLIGDTVHTVHAGNTQTRTKTKDTRTRQLFSWIAYWYAFGYLLQEHQIVH